jgi:ABC-type glycerol-3-phosphate transport system permease component
MMLPAVMMLPAAVTMIPVYLILDHIHLANTQVLLIADFVISAVPASSSPPSP